MIYNAIPAVRFAGANLNAKCPCG